MSTAAYCQKCGNRRGAGAISTGLCRNCYRVNRILPVKQKDGVIDALKEDEDNSNEIADMTGLPVAIVSHWLSELEKDGVVKKTCLVTRNPKGSPTYRRILCCTDDRSAAAAD